MNIHTLNNNWGPSRTDTGYSSHTDQGRAHLIGFIVGATIGGIIGLIIIIVIIICIIKACNKSGSRGRFVHVQPVNNAAVFTVTTTAHTQGGYPIQPYPQHPGFVDPPPSTQQEMAYGIHPPPGPFTVHGSGCTSERTPYLSASTKQ